MPAVHKIIVEDRLRQAHWYVSTPVSPSMQWVQGDRWMNHKYQNDGFSESDALYLEWQEALRRAADAEHRVSYYRERANAGLACVIILGFVITGLAVLFLLK